ncbi:MAG: ATP synthase F1 subunit gamma [Bacteroidales bacterium]|nr:ATP synthase F1 subunit gamma [Bacteroidales bacterium]
MANLKEIRIRIASVESTKQITSAMKLVAASKLRRAQDAILMMRPYAAKMHEILQNLSSGDSSDENVYGRQSVINKVLIIAITSNRGLCGAFNANVIKKVNYLLANDYSSHNQQGNVDIITVGKKASEFFAKSAYRLKEKHDHIWDNLNWSEAQNFTESILKKFSDGEYDRIDLVYNQFKNAGSQALTVEQFLPIKPLDSEAVAKTSMDYIMEPSKEVIVEGLIPKSLKVQLYKALLDSYASEHGARMTAMHKATDNATEMVKELKLVYNKARQATITNEIIEIVGGANALKG